SLKMWAQCYLFSDQLDAAWPLLKESLQQRLRTLGKSHAEYAQCLNNMGIFYLKIADYPKAASVFLEAKEIQMNTLGKMHPDCAQTANNLGLLYYEAGEYGKSELFYLESKDILYRSAGQTHPMYDQILNNLGNLYLSMGANTKAESYFLEAQTIQLLTNGANNPSYVKILNNLGILYKNMERFDQAEQLFKEAVSINEKNQTANDPNYGRSLNNLATLYYERRDYQQAERLFQEAKVSWQKNLGQGHPLNILCLTNLGECYRQLGDYPKAEQYYLEAQTLILKTLGREHPFFVVNSYNLSQLYQSLQRYEDAGTLLLEIGRINRLQIGRNTSFLSDNQIQAYTNTFRLMEDNLYSFLQAHQTPELCAEGYNNTLLMNGLALEQNRMLARALDGVDSTTIQLYEKWQSCHRRLAKRYARPLAERKKIVEVEAEAESYEKELKQRLPAFQEIRKTCTWESIKTALKPGEAAIEWVRYHFNQSDSIMYAALLIRSGDTHPQFIGICEERQLIKLLPGNTNDAVGTPPDPSRGIIRTGPGSFKGLYELLWQPLDKLLADVQTVYYSPVGTLHRLNFDAIPLPGNQILADRFRLVRLGSTRTLAIDGEGSAHRTAGSAVLFGGIYYDMDSTAILSANARIDGLELASRGADLEMENDTSRQTGNWQFLSGTEKEVNSLERLLAAAGFKPQLKKGFEATEESLKKIGQTKPSPYLLHLATHGFFFPDPRDNTQRLSLPVEQETGFKTSTNPLARSGLLMAGANHAWKTGKPLKKSMENGILTAYEISHLDLSNTELVVLSACETGLGQLQGNEGVFGLQRAFKIAGARYIIMSLWQIPDQETAVFMTAFYKQWLEAKKSIPDAFHAAQQEMRQQFNLPYLWAGFVLVE
ncbi:MAG: CHAT domain-containing protein, partial [Saprospiraceae bacterium]|nr:CHAT domain-containing protein [Saprospiraceae bacterium]